MESNTITLLLYRCYHILLLASSYNMSVCAQLCPTPGAVAPKTPLSMEFFRQEYWSGLPFPPPGNLPNPGIKSVSPALEGGFFTTKPLGSLTDYMQKAKKREVDEHFCVGQSARHVLNELQMRLALFRKQRQVHLK